jgi:hypothetical protein
MSRALAGRLIRVSSLSRSEVQGRAFLDLSTRGMNQMNEFSKQHTDEPSNEEHPPRSRRDFLVQAGLMAGTVLCLSKGDLQAADAPGDDTKVTELGLNADEIRILTNRAKALTKADLNKLGAITQANPKDKDAVIKEFNVYLKKEGKQAIVVTDIDSLMKATERVLTKTKRWKIDIKNCCCCCCAV